ncbi:O-antigen polymerase [Aeromonas veronii]|uniref:O-antigen polymerase n=1 Tax=Aeromonas veronii TaxID=654 RepID=UPI00211D4D97|nr:O-antigen polymerase [Aeromonas veronii]UUM70161.1 oligosaccharide repeat unit polymerase [Aeromonas veronii]
MKYLDKYSFFISIPLLLQFLILVLFFNIPKFYYAGVLFLPLVMLCLGISVDLIFKNGVGNSFFVDKLSFHRKKNHEFVAGLFLTLVLLLVPVDIYVNGFKILDPSSYAELNGIGRYIRHFTSFCWIAVPFSLLYIRRPVLRLLLICLGVLVPILFVDRNRLLLSFFCLVYFYVFYKRSGLIGIKRKSNIKLFLVTLGIVVLFGGLGVYRSGTSFIVLSSGDKLIEGYYPLRDVFLLLPDIFKQIILYISTPIFNFATVFYQDFINPDFLFSQLSPFDRDSYDAYPFSPILVPRYNVGTEFYPFLLYGGMQSVIMAAIFTSLLFVLVVKIHHKYNNIFTLLLFLKIAYTMFMVGFAPQIITFYNLFSIGIIICLYVVGLLMSQFLKTRQLMNCASG